MRRVIVAEFVSLDGVMENPEWTAPYWNDEIAKFKTDEMLAGDVLLLGRVTYSEFAGFWPESKDDGADHMNNIAKYVVSKTLKKADWNNSTIIKSNVADAIKKLKQQPGKDILVFGSAKLAQTLIQQDLVDRYQLLVYPVVVGKGKRMFQDGTTATLKLVEAKPFSSGVTALIYEPDRK
jgi:dihydrofolate reductase